MPQITKHDCKQKGKGNNSKHSRVGFSVSSNTVGVDDVLELLLYGGGCEMGGGHFIGEEGVEDRGHLGEGGWVGYVLAVCMHCVYALYIIPSSLLHICVQVR